MPRNCGFFNSVDGDGRACVVPTDLAVNLT
jgi:hypothetical protein